MSNMSGRFYVSIFVIYLSMFLNNTLLTTVVPVLPDILNNAEKMDEEQNAENYSEPLLDAIYKSMKPISPIETEKAAILLSSKSLIQLVINPMVAYLIPKLGYYSLLLTGNVMLMVTSFVFAYGNSFLTLAFCRGLHGIASVVITVSGMCMCAKIFSNDDELRSKYMGIILSSEALGVLTGYTVGAFVYSLYGKSTPISNPVSETNANWRNLARSPFVYAILGAIFISSSTVATLEPCLPFWLIQHMKLEKWQSGFMFLPDSFGYLLSTSTCGLFAYKFGRWRTTVISLLIIGVCSIMIPSATTLVQLSLPHFGIGLGIGAVDCALIPMLANYADLQQNIHYGLVYALQQVVTSSSYICGALLAGELMQLIGFPSIIRMIGVFNIIYSTLLILYGKKHSLLENSDIPRKFSYESIQQVELMSMKNTSANYRPLKTSTEDSD